MKPLLLSILALAAGYTTGRILHADVLECGVIGDVYFERERVTSPNIGGRYENSR